MPDILMPKLSDSMEQGTILSWLKASGDQVQIGEEVLEIETDKSTVTYAAEDAGVLETLAQEGTTVAVGEPIGRIGAGAAESSAAESPAAESPAAELVASVTVAPAIAAANGHGRVSSATPLAKRTAAAYGVEIGAVQGTGPLGRVTRTDVLRSAGINVTEKAVLPTNPASASLRPGSTRKQASRLQQLIARRMSEAKATVPHFQVQTEAEMGSVISLRAELKSLAERGEPIQMPSLNDIIVKAAAIALKEHPLANGSFQDDGFVLHDQVNIGVAVAADDALVVPTVFDADIKSLGQIARDTRSLADRVRDGQISPAELEGGTFTVSNLGMFGMTAITPVINPPQAAILGVGSLRETLARVDGEIIDRILLTLTLSCDHRILYGADASRFLARIRELLESPLTLVF